MVDNAKKDQVVGSAKETAGKVLGDKDTEAEGRVQKMTGKVKETVEDAAATVKAGVRKLTDDD